MVIWACLWITPHKEWRGVDPDNINVTDQTTTNDSVARVSTRKRGLREVTILLLAPLIPETQTELLGPTKTAKLFTYPKTLTLTTQLK